MIYGYDRHESARRRVDDMACSVAQLFVTGSIQDMFWECEIFRIPNEVQDRGKFQSASFLRLNFRT